VYDGIDPVTGKKKYIRETVKGDSKAAEDRVAEIITDRNRGEYVEPSKLTLYKFLTDYFLPTVKANATARTYRSYESITRVHVAEDPISKKKLTALELTDFENYKLRKLGSERKDPNNPGQIAPKTVKNHLIMLKASMAYACELKLLKYSPAHYLKFPHVPKYKPVTFDEKNAEKFLLFAENDRFYFLYVLALYFGKRQGEIRGLRRQDVDLDNLTASVRQAVHGSGNLAEWL
jgi:integrase